MRQESSRKQEYPYSARYAAGPRSVEGRDGRWTWSKKWLRRLGIATAIAAVGLLALMGVFVSRWIGQVAMVAQLTQPGCSVTYSHEYPGEQDRVPFLLREWLGNDLFSEVWGVSAQAYFGRLNPNDTNAICNISRRITTLRSFVLSSDSLSFEQISNWPHLDQLDELQLESPNLTDADVVRISQMPRLRVLRLSSAKITDAAIDQLTRAPYWGVLERLDLSDSKVAAEGFRALASADIPHLVLARTTFSDSDLMLFSDNDNLRTLDILETQVTPEGVKAFLAARKARLAKTNDSERLSLVTDYDELNTVADVVESP